MVLDANRKGSIFRRRLFGHSEQLGEVLKVHIVPVRRDGFYNDLQRENDGTG